MLNLFFHAFLILSFMSCSAFAEQRTARIFEIGKTDGSPRFQQTTEVDKSASGDIEWSSVIKDLAGKVVMTEKASMKKDRVVSQYVEQLQIGEAYELKVEGDKAHFTTFTISSSGEKKVKESNNVNIEDNFITGPATEFYLQKHWQEILDSKKVHVEFGVFEISKAVGFVFQRVPVLPGRSEGAVSIRMKAANFLISMMVDPIFLEFDKEGKRMQYFKGRTPLRIQYKNEWKPFDAEIFYP